MADRADYVLPPTQHLVMEVLVARWRTGERTWTFPTTCLPALRALEYLDLAWHKSGTVGGTRLAGLTDRGREAWLDPTYVPPFPQPATPSMDLVVTTWGPDGPPVRPGRIRAWLKQALSGAIEEDK